MKRRHLKRRHIIMLVEQLEMYARAGLPVDMAFEGLSGTFGKSQLQRLTRVRTSIQAGRRISDALSLEFGLPTVVVGLIASGEASGTLADTLSSCKQLLERQDELVKKCLSALLYPMVIGGATVVLTLGLIEGIMPQIIPLLTSLHAQLPLLTRVVICISNMITRYWWQGSLVFAALSTGCIYVYRRQLRVRSYVQKLFLLLPVAGSLAGKHSLAIFFEAFGSMIAAGIPIHNAYRDALQSVAFIPIREQFRTRADPLMRGEPCSTICELPIRGMPGYAVPILRAGEQSGMLGVCVRRVAQMLDGELGHSLKKLTALLEPILMIGMGSIVGSIALSIMMPIYDISKALQK